MSDESSFEFINKKAELELADNENGCQNTTSESKWLADIPPPSDLPSFIPVSTASKVGVERINSVFYPSTFSPAIPESKAQRSEEIAAEEGDELFSNAASGLFDWVKDTVGNKGGTLFTKVAEKAKNSVGSVITALDPQMRDFSTAESVEVIVASDKEVEVNPVREAFHDLFTKSSVRGLDTDDVCHAKQIVGFEAAYKTAMAKIENIRRQNNVKGLVIAVQNFVAEIQEEKWYDLDLLLLSDVERPLLLDTYTQMTPVPHYVVNVARDDTAPDYNYKNEGFSVSIGNVIGGNLQVHPSEWQETMTGLSRRERIFSGAKVLINLYKNTLL